MITSCLRLFILQVNNRWPYHSINFVIAHDGFTLRDLVSYNFKVPLLNSFLQFVIAHQNLVSLLVLGFVAQ